MKTTDYDALTPYEKETLELFNTIITCLRDLREDISADLESVKVR